MTVCKRVSFVSNYTRFCNEGTESLRTGWRNGLFLTSQLRTSMTTVIRTAQRVELRPGRAEPLRLSARHGLESTVLPSHSCHVEWGVRLIWVICRAPNVCNLQYTNTAVLESEKLLAPWWIVKTARLKPRISLGTVQVVWSRVDARGCCVTGRICRGERSVHVNEVERRHFSVKRVKERRVWTGNEWGTRHPIAGWVTGVDRPSVHICFYFACVLLTLLVRQCGS